MAKTVTFDPDGSVIVEQITGADLPDGQKQIDRWRCNPDQAEKHLPTFQGQAQKLTAGDVSAIKDASSDYRKQKGS
jgi:hypothetical protein